MTSLIHPSSTVGNSVQLGENVIIGPFCYLDGNISIGDGTELKSHISISGNTTIGENNIFYPFSNIGCDPQDLKFSGEDSFLEIGNSNIFRENVTISKGTKDGGMLTSIKNNNLFMTGVHIAHGALVMTGSLGNLLLSESRCRSQQNRQQCQKERTHDRGINAVLS